MMNIEMLLLLGLVDPGTRMGRIGGRRLYGKVSCSELRVRKQCLDGHK